MKQHDNDNAELSFVSLAALTANVTRYLQTDKQKNEQGERKPEPGKRDDDKGSEHRAYVEKRLRELAAFERRVSGRKD